VGEEAVGLAGLQRAQVHLSKVFDYQRPLLVVEVYEPNYLIFDGRLVDVGEAFKAVRVVSNEVSLLVDLCVLRQLLVEQHVSVEHNLPVLGEPSSDVALGPLVLSFDVLHQVHLLVQSHLLSMHLALRVWVQVGLA